MKDQNNIYPSAVRSRKGFTLVEVMVSMTILAIGLLGVAMMQVSSITGNTFSREMAVATGLGQDLLEKLNSAPYIDFAAGNFDDTLSLGPHNNAELLDVNSNPQPNPIDAKGMSTTSGGAALPLGTRPYTRTWTVTDPAAGTTFDGTTIKTILVTVTWDDSIGTTHSVTLEGTKVQR